jgi:hypothetical protein
VLGSTGQDKARAQATQHFTDLESSDTGAQKLPGLPVPLGTRSLLPVDPAHGGLQQVVVVAAGGLGVVLHALERCASRRVAQIAGEREGRNILE